ncbi:hypothetical protein PT974_06239 [Cladobotryum mycophilum]|uniref:Ribosome recycling factor domain-containing protein n=1 Tax=Cladobotryum mycophilum TaxID=491253 RepID=A0ABR0SL09_9HYPO
MSRRSLIGLCALTRLQSSAPRALPLISVRAFSQTPAYLKKRKIAAASDSPPPSNPPTSKKTTPASSSPSSSSSSSKADHGPAPDPENPLDFSSLTAAYAPIDVHFKAELQQVLHGGRFNPDSLGAIPVTLKSEEGLSFQLREVAQVVPRSGRTISLLVNDKKYIKDIMSAIQKSAEFNQQPQRSEDNELELLLKVELERKEDLVRRVRDSCQAWRERVRQVRTRHEKTLQDWRKNKVVLPDVVKKAEKELQKLQDKKMKDIDQEEARTVKQLERN